MKTALRITLILGGLLALVIGTSVYLWWQLEDVEMGVHATVALILGIVFASAMWAGLMWLMFYSRKRGHDDNVR